MKTVMRVAFAPGEFCCHGIGTDPYPPYGHSISIHSTPSDSLRRNFSAGMAFGSTMTRSLSEPGCCEKDDSIYQMSIDGKNLKRVIKNARFPSVSTP